MGDGLRWEEIMLVSFWMKLALTEVESEIFFLNPKDAYLIFGGGWGRI